MKSLNNLLILGYILIMCNGCNIGKNVELTDRKSIESEHQYPIIASEKWTFENDEVSKVRLDGIRPLNESEDLEEGVLVFSSDRMLKIAAENYYRGLKEQNDDPGIFWFGRGMNGVKVSIVELGADGKSYNVEADSIVGKQD